MHTCSTKWNVWRLGGNAEELGPHASLVPCTALADEAHPYEGQGPIPTGHGHERGEHPMTEGVGLPRQEGHGPFENERDEPNMEQHDMRPVSYTHLTLPTNREV